MYLYGVTIILAVLYFVLTFVFSFFFEARWPKITKHAMFSVGLIALLSTLGYKIAFSIPDMELGNRFLHAFGGGFLGFLVCFLVVKDSKLLIGKFRFFVFSFLVVTAMGVANEILEFTFQNYSFFVFADTVNDTWLDLISNTIGILAGALLLTPFIVSKETSRQS